MQLTLDHVHIFAASARKTADDYVALLGAREIEQYETPNGLRVILQLGGAQVYIEERAGGTGAVDHLAFATRDLDAAVAHIENSGGTILTPPRQVREGLRIAFVAPEGGGKTEIVQRG
ncbi:hypothetical protein DRW48_11165 [Paracoccus suum]|uniref:VOC domain-containing protein n=1 Tax=Paracoccus suum TaxID=2259340 RepID=A0A344PLC2_9RHOB|nr:VOC family protein [Paracoccus suum]AXC50177.1 hypothetical protein DRW48_11165 [Paracoccus suum]